MNQNRGFVPIGEHRSLYLDRIWDNVLVRSISSSVLAVPFKESGSWEEADTGAVDAAYNDDESSVGKMSVKLKIELI